MTTGPLGSEADWNAYVRQVEYETTGSYKTPRYGTPGYDAWKAAGSPDDRAFLYTEEWAAFTGNPQPWATQQPAPWQAPPYFNEFLQQAAANTAAQNAGQPIPYPNAGTGGASTADMSAKAILDGALAQMGLQSLGNTVWEWWKAGHPIEQIMLDIRNTPEYKARFPAMDTLSKAGHAISEAAYINLEEGYKQVMRAAGLPSGFYDSPTDFAKLISNEVSPAEFQERVTDYTNLAFQMPREVLDEFARQSGFNDWYGTGWSNGDLAAFLMNPDVALPAITRSITRAQVGGASVIAGYGQLDPYTIARLAETGVDFNKALSGFGNLLHYKELFSGLPGTTEQGIDYVTQVAGQFGLDANAANVIEARASSRKAEFEGGGQTSGSQRGQSGAGASR